MSKIVMQIILIHGNGLSAISQRVSQIRTKFDPLSIIEFTAKVFDFKQIAIELSTPQLFSEDRLVVLEDFEDVDLEGLSVDDSLTLVLRFNKQLPATNKLLKNAQNLKLQVIALNEPEEKAIFPFLDALADQDKKAVLKLDKILDQYGGQYLLTMIFYMLRRMVNVPKKLPPFVIKKLELQQKKFGLEKIKKIYDYALEADFKIKNGLLEEKIGLTLLVDKILTA